MKPRLLQGPNSHAEPVPRTVCGQHYRANNVSRRKQAQNFKNGDWVLFKICMYKRFGLVVISLIFPQNIWPFWMPQHGAKHAESLLESNGWFLFGKYV
jgi:hypothetical protein